MSPRIATGFPVVLMSGRKRIEALVVIVPDGRTTPPAGLLPGLPDPILIQHGQWRALLDLWRRNAPPDRREPPTVGEIALPILRRKLRRQKAVALTFPKP